MCYELLLAKITSYNLTLLYCVSLVCAMHQWRSKTWVKMLSQPFSFLPIQVQDKPCSYQPTNKQTTVDTPETERPPVSRAGVKDFKCYCVHYLL